MCDAVLSGVVTEELKRERPSGVWATAVGVARVRARESARENPLFRDPLAQAFAAAGGVWPSSPPLPDDEGARRRWSAVAFSIVIRTKFLDDLLRRASASGIRQVVLLGAGMDSRAFRMDWPEGTRLFEVDTAAPLDFKASVLRQEGAVARCERITVTVDLRDDWPGALAAAGHDPTLPTVWIAEGLLIYLPQDAVELLLGRIGARSAAGSRMGLTLGSSGVIERFAADATPGSTASMWVSEMPDDPVGWLAGHGWEAETHTVRERAAAYGRPVNTPPRRGEGPGGLVSAVRRQASGTTSG
ncbi:methyltransferase (TIGR00027 family) [Streptomyces sp. B3I8]|nr:methyltransferase (TIGR00027 family) [Streptomyces sp. B3I8]